MSKKLIIVGAGQAGFAFAEQARKLMPDATITILGDEPHLPYQRPPLSKRYVKNEIEQEKLLFRPATWFEKKAIECHLSDPVVSIHPEQQSVETQSGQHHDYDDLLLATGASPHRLPEKIGGHLQGVLTLRDISDADRFREVLVPGKALLVVGGGYIGLEAASVAAALGMQVTVVEQSQRILQRVACEQTSDYFRALHQRHNVTILESCGLQCLVGSDNQVQQAQLSNGDVLDVAAVVVGIGVAPNVALAQSAGIAVDNGITIDAYGATSVPHIYASGDCANFEWRGGRIRLESVQHANDHAKLVARNVLGEQQGYEPKPWFWSEQFDVVMQIAGLSAGYNRVVQREGSKPGSGSFWYFNNDTLLAADVMNDPGTYMLVRRLLDANVVVTADQAADASVDLKALLAEARI